jgi:hypothetical protein
MASVESYRRKMEIIFLISAQRSGSTLLQSMLASHPSVHTEPEPWLLLPLVYSRRTNGIWTEYDCEFSTDALEAFLARIDGSALYDECIRSFVETLYARALAGGGARYFLDKTPRNFLVIDDISRIFPTAKLVFLLRHPIAIFSSMLDGVSCDWSSMLQDSGYRLDLLAAPNLIAKAVRSIKDPIVVHYEDLVRTPERTMQALCARLGLRFDSATLRYDPPPPEAAGDHKSIHRHTTAVADYVDGWRNGLRGPGALGFARAYAASLDEDVLDIYRVNKSELLKEIDSLGRSASSAKWVRRLSAWDNTTALSRASITYECAMERRGFRRAVGSAARKLWSDVAGRKPALKWWREKA